MSCRSLRNGDVGEAPPYRARVLLLAVILIINHFLTIYRRTHHEESFGLTPKRMWVGGSLIMSVRGMKHKDLPAVGFNNLFHTSQLLQIFLSNSADRHKVSRQAPRGCQALGHALSIWLFGGETRTAWNENSVRDRHKVMLGSFDSSRKMIPKFLYRPWQGFRSKGCRQPKTEPP